MSKENPEIYWTPLESNPDAMNKFLWAIGVPKEWSIVDIYGLDEELLQFVEGPVVALILLYPDSAHKHVLSMTEDSDTSVDDNRQNVFFMKQTIHNACGTVALIHSVANNCHQINLKDNSSLKAYIDASRELAPEKRGRLLETNNDICNAHHVCASEGQTHTPLPDANVDGHFVAFVNNNGNLYHLDGGRQHPINHGTTSDDTFLLDAARVIRKFISKDPNNCNFTVVALANQNQDLM